MKYSICIFLFIVGVAMSEYCYDAAKEFCTSALEKYPELKVDKYYCNRLKQFARCFKGTFKDCNDYLKSIYKNNNCDQTTKMPVEAVIIMVWINKYLNKPTVLYFRYDRICNGSHDYIHPNICW
ncbi:uncharacterized protein LOC128249851 [Octopus bimaculoides]|uniref:uncharacterized protein LOC128249851 n=1 Tax=Octopus bimaculoides TaxID=37653 RepID=UPI0022E2646E|nr:uncharacterized protein LOC128249851 [Octopus bimaculoides]